MAAKSVSESPSAVRFCPFCREPFEALALCPTHELHLVPFRELPADAAAQDDTQVPLATPHFGRAPLLLGAILTLLAFFLPLASLSGQASASSTVLALARARDVWLWLVPMSAVGQLVVLRRRRTPRELRGARVFVLLCALVPSCAVIFTWIGVRAAAATLSSRLQSVVSPHLGFGALLVWLAALPMLYAGITLGVAKAARVKLGTSQS